MARKEIENQLEGMQAADVSSMDNMENDDLVLTQFTPEEAEAAAAMLEEMDNRTRVAASKKKKKDLYNNGTMFSVDGEFDIITDKDARYQSFQKLNQSLTSGSILKGKIIKSKKRDNSDPDHPEMPTAIVQLDDDKSFEIHIPITDFLQTTSLQDIQGESPTDKLNYMDLLINKRTGSDVYFIVKKVDEEKGFALASRTEAMSRNIRKFWFARERDGDFKINTGDMVIGNVMYVERTRMCVDVLGVEKMLDIADVSWIRYSDLREADLKWAKLPGGKLVKQTYHAGDNIQLRVLGLKRTFKDQEGNILLEKDIEGKSVRAAGIAINLSAKACTKNPDVEFYNNFSMGEKVEAEITHLDENGIFCVLAGLRSARIRYSQDNTDVPNVGSRCLVRIVKMEDDTKRIHCEIVQSYR